MVVVTTINYVYFNFSCKCLFLIVTLTIETIVNVMNYLLHISFMITNEMKLSFNSICKDLKCKIKHFSIAGCYHIFQQNSSCFKLLQDFCFFSRKNDFCQIKSINDWDYAISSNSNKTHYSLSLPFCIFRMQRDFLILPSTRE